MCVYRMSTPVENRGRRPSDPSNTSTKRQLPQLPKTSLPSGHRPSAPPSFPLSSATTNVIVESPQETKVSPGKSRRLGVMSRQLPGPIAESPSPESDSRGLSPDNDAKPDNQSSAGSRGPRRSSQLRLLHRRVSRSSLASGEALDVLSPTSEISMPQVSPYRRISRRKRSSVRQSDTQQRTTLQAAFTLRKVTLELNRLSDFGKLNGTVSVCVARNGRMASTSEEVLKSSCAETNKAVAEFDNATVSLPVTLAALPTQQDAPKFLRKDVDIRVKFSPDGRAGASRTLAKTSVDVSQFLSCEQKHFCERRQDLALGTISRWRHAPLHTASLDMVVTGRVLRTVVTDASRPTMGKEEDLSDIR